MALMVQLVGASLIRTPSRIDVKARGSTCSAAYSTNELLIRPCSKKTVLGQGGPSVLERGAPN